MVWLFVNGFLLSLLNYTVLPLLAQAPFPLPILRLQSGQHSTHPLESSRETPFHSRRRALPFPFLDINMTSIASLLNPEPESRERYPQQLPTPSPSRFAREYRQSPPPRQKKQKISKDAAVFTRGRTRGELRYPPCEYQNQELAEAHREFQIHPMGHITEYPRHIPYNSEKKSFLEKTGRESFEGTNAVP